jgi:hypothetical protein
MNVSGALRWTLLCVSVYLSACHDCNDVGCASGLQFDFPQRPALPEGTVLKFEFNDKTVSCVFEGNPDAPSDCSSAGIWLWFSEGARLYGIMLPEQFPESVTIVAEAAGETLFSVAENPEYDEFAVSDCDQAC